MNMYIHKYNSSQVYKEKNLCSNKTIQNLFKYLSWGLIQYLVVSPKMASFPILKC